MSGLEVVGVAASLIQIADLGAKVSVKLFSFYRHATNINQSMQNLSSEVALTCNILRELGEILGQDESSKLCSNEALRTAKQVLDECRRVLHQLHKISEGADHSAKSRFRRATGTIRNVLIESNVDSLKQNLERLKSTMLLLLNVIMYAAQVRQHVFPTRLEDQRSLIESLLEERDKRVQGPLCTRGIDRVEPKDYDDDRTATVTTHSSDKYNTREQDELEVYDKLIRQMLHEVDLCKAKLEKDRQLRIRDGVLSIHANEVVRFQLTHGHSILQRFDVSAFEKQAKNNDVFPDADPQASDISRKAEIPHGVFYTKYDSMVADYFSYEHEDMRKSVLSTSNAVDDKAKTNRMRDEEFKRAAEEDAKAAAAKPSRLKGWFGGWAMPNTTAETRPIRATLGEESSFYYDKESKRWISKSVEHSSAVNPPLARAHKGLIGDLVEPYPARKGKKSNRRNKKSRYVDYVADHQFSGTLPSQDATSSIPSDGGDSIYSEPSSKPAIDAATAVHWVTGSFTHHSETSVEQSVQSSPTYHTSQPTPPDVSRQVSLPFDDSDTSEVDKPNDNALPPLLPEGTEPLETWSDRESDRTSPPSDSATAEWHLEEPFAPDSSLPTSFEALVSHWTTLGEDEIS